MRKPCCSERPEEINKGGWSKEEDEKLIDYIKTHGVGCWRSIPKAAGLQRCGKSCRLRWINYLRPDIKRGNFGPDEEDLVIKLHALLGNRWSLIAGRLPGRTDNEVKNYWNSHIRKKLIQMGIDPKNHKPHKKRLTNIPPPSDDQEAAAAATGGCSSLGSEVTISTTTIDSSSQLDQDYSKVVDLHLSISHNQYCSTLMVPKKENVENDDEHQQNCSSQLLINNFQLVDQSPTLMLFR